MRYSRSPVFPSIVRRYQEHLIDPPPIFVPRFDTLPADIRASATDQTPHWTRPIGSKYLAIDICILRQEQLNGHN